MSTYKLNETKEYWQLRYSANVHFPKRYSKQCTQGLWLGIISTGASYTKQTSRGYQHVSPPLTEITHAHIYLKGHQSFSNINPLHYLEGKGPHGVCTSPKAGTGISSTGNSLGERFKIFSCDCITCVEMLGLLSCRRM